MGVLGQRKSVEAYEREATRVGECLVHPSRYVARRLYQLRWDIILPRELYVCHECDNLHCIRDLHHFIGTHIDNVKDAAKKGKYKAAHKDDWANKTAEDRTAHGAKLQAGKRAAKRRREERIKKDQRLLNQSGYGHPWRLQGLPTEVVERIG